VVDKKLSEEQKQRDGRDRLFAVHSSRLILHLVYKTLPDTFFSSSSNLMPSESKEIEDITSEILQAVISKTNNLYPNSYPANIFRNITKCEEIIEKVQNNRAPNLAPSATPRA